MSHALKNALYHAKRPYHLLKTGLLKGAVAERRYDFPARDIEILAITGTDGKTTTSTMLYHLLKEAGVRVALLSTVAAYIDDEEIDTGFHVTSPQPDELHKFLRDMVDRGIEYIVMEVTSHGLYQYRNWGVTPTIAGVTNITREHLDYHITYENYVAAKAMLLEQAEKGFINKDNMSHGPLQRILKPAPTRVESYSATDRIYHTVKHAIEDRFPEPYNRMNARLAYNMARELDISTDDIAAAFASFPGVPGRMEAIPSKQPYDIIVDFAHTANGLEEALEALRKRRSQRPPEDRGRIIAIYGCAGLRDIEKRPLMGEIGTRLADLAVFTAEDPRTENVWSIIRQMKSGVTNNHDKIISIADRRDAIKFAMTELAQPNDVIAIFGKGHERSMCYGTTEYPWHDKTAVLEILQTIEGTV